MELEETIEKFNYLKTIRDLKDYVKDNDCMLADAIEVVLNHLTKQEKMIELMVEKYNDDFGDIGDFCQHEYCSEKYNCKECIKQYFENKAEESE